jgi:hypothetical protein
MPSARKETEAFWEGRTPVVTGNVNGAFVDGVPLDQIQAHLESQSSAPE